jgi:hypothetical protein
VRRNGESINEMAEKRQNESESNESGGVMKISAGIVSMKAKYHHRKRNVESNGEKHRRQ